MSFLNLSDDESDSFRIIIEDLHFLFGLDEILSQDIQDVLSKLKSDEVRKYVRSLAIGSKSETALREAFFAGKSILSKFLGGDATPEVNVGHGFIDYILRVNGRFVLVELKSLFEADFEEAKTKSLKRLRKKELKWEEHKHQVLKYLQKGSEFIILTNLKDWFLFNKECSPANFKYFYTANVFSLIEEYNRVGNLWDYLRRKDAQSIREELDKRFFESLRTWVSKLSEVGFDTDEKTKIEQIIKLLNKFIFIQTLDDFFVIDARWIKVNWDEIERKWSAKGKYQVLKRFLDEVDKWFYEYYDTELFRTNLLQYVKKDTPNIDKFYDTLQLVLGITYWQSMFRGFRGVMQYNFRYIDEDVFGKAYEAFLAEVKHDEGIYYTPKYITEYIVERTVGKTYDDLISKIKESLQKENFNCANKLLKQFVSIKVLDPACGSGSFLIKTVRKIMEKYHEITSLLEELKMKNSRFAGSLVRPKEVEEKLERILELSRIIQAENDRDLISLLLLRHIYGNDLDNKALEVAKVNIWLEAIKLAPAEFRFDKLPMETNHILPDLEMNLVNGNTVVGLPENDCINLLQTRYSSAIQKLSSLRREYLENPTKPELVEEIKEIKRKIKKELDDDFRKYLTEENLSERLVEEAKPLYWPLELWHFYFSDEQVLDENHRGADIVIGNPPYERIQVLKKKSIELVDFLNCAKFESATGNYDLAVIFVEKGYKLLRRNGNFGYIVTNKFMKANYGQGLRKFLSKNSAVSEIIDFGHQQVFEDATTYTCLLFLDNKKESRLKYALIRNLERSIDQLRRLDENDDFVGVAEEVSSLPMCDFTEAPYVFISKDDRVVFERINENAKLEKIYKRIFQGLVTGSDAVFILEPREDYGNLIRVYSKSQNKEYVLEKQLVKPFLFGRNLQKWVVFANESVILFPYNIDNGKAKLIDETTFPTLYPKSWKYLLDNRSVLESREGGKWKNAKNWYALGRRQNLEQFEQNKIMTKVLSYRACFSIDANRGYYFAGAGGSNGYGITIGKELSLEYVCGILNSSLLDWNLRKVSTSHRGGFWIYAKRFLEKLPIKIPESESEKKTSQAIVTIVSKIINLENSRFELLKLWSEVSNRLKNSELSLTKLLSEDERKIQNGDFESSWISKVTVYPSSKSDILHKGFNDFWVMADSTKPILDIFGITKEGKEQEILEFSFERRELMLQIYYSLLSTLSSHLKIGTLDDLLNKTLIPVILPNTWENTASMIKKLEDEFSKKSPESQDCDIVKIDNLIFDHEAKIDGLVFKIYSLNKQEINMVMNSLELLPSYEQLVLKYS